MPSPKRAGSAAGASFSYTLNGPPVRMIPMGASARTSSAGVDPGRMTECTRSDRTDRAISSLYCPPKSSTNTV